MMYGIVWGNYLKGSVRAAGMDPDNLPTADASSMSFAEGSSKPKAWKSIWGSGQGIGDVRDITTAGDLVDRIGREYRAAGARLAAEFVGG